jgi:transposase
MFGEDTMPGPSPCAVVLAREVQAKLESTCRTSTSPQRNVLRARIILLAAQGLSNADIATRLAIQVATVRKWRRRFVARGLAGLCDLRRPGRPSRFDQVARCQLISLACRPVPPELCRTQWTAAALRQVLVDAGLVARISETTIRRILDDVDLRPQRFRMWVHSPDPDFKAKVTELCTLYTRPPGPDEVVLCVDEKTGMQALRRRFPGRRPSPGEAGRFEFEYRRQGTRCLTAAFDVHTGNVLGRVTKRRTKQDLMAFMEALARRYPTQRVHVVWDNLNTHHGPVWGEFNRRHGGRFSFHYTPIHASWCNQVELWFSILARRVLHRASFCDAADLEHRVLNFIAHWNRSEAHPFAWTSKGYPLQTGTSHERQQAA